MLHHQQSKATTYAFLRTLPQTSASFRQRALSPKPVPDCACTSATRPHYAAKMSATEADPLAASPARTDPPSTSDLLSFYRLVGRLKSLKRAGWVQSAVNEPESVADHMFRMALIALTLPRSDDSGPAPDPAHLVKLAIVHDLAEATVGDITPADGVPEARKHALEQDAMLQIRDVQLAGSPVGFEIYRLWEEYEQACTPAAKIVKQIDKLEMILQADEYERQQGLRLDGFFHSTRGKFSTPALVALDNALREDRDRRLQKS